MPIPILSPDPSLFVENYLLRDDFNDVRAAGSVNGTPATPGPGARVVNDSGNRLSLSGGAAVFSGGGSAWGNPGLWWGGLSRKLGRMIIIGPINVTTRSHTSYGWSSTQSGIAAELSFYFNQANSIDCYGWAAAGVAVASGIAASTDYYIALVLRAVGGFGFIKGGIYTNWTLLMASQYLSASSVYPAIANHSSTLTAGAARVPVFTYIPAPLASDSFNRANGVLGSTDGAGHTEANGGGGLAWTSQLGTWGISTNTAMSSVLDASGISIATIPCGTANVVAQATATRSGNEVGMCLRYVDSNNYLLAQHDGTNCRLIERVAGVNTTRITAAAAIGEGALVCVLDGAGARLYLNAALIGTYAALVNTTATTHGIFTTNTGNTLDNAVVWARGNEGQYSILDRWTR